jgi:putative transposase
MRHPLGPAQKGDLEMESLQPRNHAERVAIFRHGVIGALVAQQFAHGELREELRRLSQVCYRAPDAACTRRFSVATLERWYYACKKRGPSALEPAPRADKGHGRCFDAEVRELLCDIRREHPSASVPLILDTLIEEGRLDANARKHAAAIRKLFAERGLPRRSARVEQADVGKKTRLRWQAERPGALWQGDVCHFAIFDGATKKPVRIHGLLDDASRYVVALEARWTEQETEMLALMVDALRREGLPDALYLDNGATYRGEVLATACQRLGILLLHPKPHDPQARGKMERFWRTLREGLLDFCKGEMTLDELNARLRNFVDRYHSLPHAGLLGRSPRSVYQAHSRTDDLTEEKLRDALTIRERRRVSNDNVVSIDGALWELEQGFLAGKTVTVLRSYFDPEVPPAVEVEGKRFSLHRVDPVHNAHRKRGDRHETPARRGVRFDPAEAMAKASKKSRGDA